MRIIINESQLRQIIENESNENLLEVSIDDFLSAENLIIKQCKKQGYDGIKIIGNWEIVYPRVSLRQIKKILNEVVVVDGHFNIIPDMWDTNYDYKPVELGTLGNLRKVTGSLEVSGFILNTLDKLEEVGDDLWLFGTQIENFDIKPNVGGDMYIRDSSLIELSDKEIRDKINVSGKIYRD